MNNIIIQIIGNRINKLNRDWIYIKSLYTQLENVLSHCDNTIPDYVRFTPRKKIRINYLKFLNSLSEQERIYAIGEYPILIRYFKDPSEALQLKAVSIDALSIKFIRNPTINTQRLAINHNLNAIFNIHNLSVEIIKECFQF